MTHVSGQGVPIYIEERAGLRRRREAVRLGVPIPRGRLEATSTFAVVDFAGTPQPSQGRVLGRWPDGTVKWLLLDTLVDLEPGERTTLFLQASTGEGGGGTVPATEVRAREEDGAVVIDTGAVSCELRTGPRGPITAVHIGATRAMGEPPMQITLQGRDGVTYHPEVERLTILERGPVRATVRADGWFHDRRRQTPLHLRACASFVAGSPVVELDIRIRNARAAVHPGGLWDLGDPGSCYFTDLTLSLRPGSPVRAVRWRAQPHHQDQVEPDQSWLLYQDSSGGDNWDSANHLDRHSRSTVHFPGYRINGTVAPPGSSARATPSLALDTAEGGGVSATVKHFWQNFPKALRWQAGTLDVALFPREAGQEFELQGGEQKRHTVWIDCATSPEAARLTALHLPVAAWVDPESVEASRALLWFTAASPDDDPRYAAYVGQIVDGPHAFVAKRELVDEFGWRNFGDLYADHEAIHHRSSGAFVSHYNNQYDFVYGAFLHAHRSGDARWWSQMTDAATHLIDIDIYHTRDDKAAFDGGLFWHTDHYVPAATSTHRTYSRANGGRGYGGGPSNEHNYTSGLLHYYYATGDPEAVDAICELADWVLALDDGANTLFALIDSGPTGGASRTLADHYHRPGRGAGNSVNALLDAYALTRARRYLAKAEEIIQRCIHPDDDITALRLDDPEHRWSYLVFLQVLGKYLAYKQEAHELDYAFHYGRESLLHYSEWITEHEVPYQDVLHKVEIPTETWPAHDVRKSHVLRIAATLCSGPLRERFNLRARFFYDRCLGDLATFPTAHFTRPLVILCVNGWYEAYLRKHEGEAASVPPHNYDFGLPSAFVPQRVRLGPTLAARLRVVREEVTRVARARYHALRAAVRGRL